jgi:Fe-S-cluster containining protein
VTPEPSPRVRVLAIHAGYRCRNTGVCCSSGWDVPVEPVAEERLRAALGDGRLRPACSPRPGGAACFRAVSGLPHGARVVLAADGAGRCVFLEADRRCAVHRQLGLEALASACRDFPRVATLTPLGVSITLSHFCPTAAAMLFAPAVPDAADRPDPDGLRIVLDPPGFPPSWPYEGLDARDALPPLLRPGVLMGWPSLERWERFAVSVLADAGRAPEVSLDLLAGAAEEARAWTPDEGPFEELFARVLEAALARGGQGERLPRDPARRGSRGWSLVAGCVPHRALLPPAPEGLDGIDDRAVAPAWSTLGRPIRRWLAAKAFASWTLLQGGGLRTTVAGLRLALAVLRAEAARGCAESRRVLDGDILKEAVRRADLLLVHLADPSALARRLSAGEAGGRLAAW